MPVETLHNAQCDIVSLSELGSVPTNASDLTLRGLWFIEEESASSLSKFLSSLGSLSTISFHECWFSPSILQVVFYSCPSLQRLSVTNCRDWRLSLGLPFSSLIAPRNLHSIICDGSSPIVTDTLSMCTFSPGLPTHLHVDYRSGFSGNLLCLLKAWRDTLESVEVFLPWSSALMPGFTCSRLRVPTVPLATVNLFFHDLVPSSTTTFPELRVILQMARNISFDEKFEVYWGDIRNTGEIIVKAGVQKLVWQISLPSLPAGVDKDEFERRLRNILAVPDGKCRMEFVWENMLLVPYRGYVEESDSE